MKQVQCIRVVVDKNDSATGFENKAEQGARSARRTGIVQQSLGDPGSLERDFRDEPIATVNREDVAALCDCQAEWGIQSSSFLPIVRVSPIPAKRQAKQIRGRVERASFAAFEPPLDLTAAIQAVPGGAQRRCSADNFGERIENAGYSRTTFAILQVCPYGKVRKSSAGLVSAVSVNCQQNVK